MIIVESDHHIAAHTTTMADLKSRMINPDATPRPREQIFGDFIGHERTGGKPPETDQGRRLKSHEDELTVDGQSPGKVHELSLITLFSSCPAGLNAYELLLCWQDQIDPYIMWLFIFLFVLAFVIGLSMEKSSDEKTADRIRNLPREMVEGRRLEQPIIRDDNLCNRCRRVSEKSRRSQRGTNVESDPNL